MEEVLWEKLKEAYEEIAELTKDRNYYEGMYRFSETERCQLEKELKKLKGEKENE
jgi:hypothetical protein